MENNKLQNAIDSKLLENRKIFLWGMVDDKSAKYVVERLLYLEMTDPGKEIQIILNSPGGYVTSGFAIYDTMKGITSPISVVCSGLAASMGAILLSAGTKGRRFVLPHSRVMIHQPSGGAGGTASDIKIQVEEIVKTRNLGAKILAENCGQTVEKILKDFDRDHWMSAEESLEYGIIDGIMDKMA